MTNEKYIDLHSLYRDVDENKIKSHSGIMQSAVGEILLNIDDKHMSEAEDWIQKAINTNKENGMMFYLGRDHALYAELFKRKGDLTKAKENMTKAIEIYKECGADGWVKVAEKELLALQ